MCWMVCLVKIWKKKSLQIVRCFLRGISRLRVHLRDRYLKKISFGSQLMEKDLFCCGNKRTVKTKANRREDGLLALKVEELLVAT